MMLVKLRRFLFLAVGLLCIGNIYAQSVERFCNRLLLPDVSYGSRVIVNEYGNSGEIVKSMESGERKVSKVKGYRIRIFLDNKQNSRSMAASTQARFSEMFPNVPVQMTYENPYWKVTVGNCLTNEEAIILWGRVKGAFDLAFIIREDIPVSELM